MALSAEHFLLLEDLRDELSRGRVYECSLRDAQWHLDGFQSGESIYIDPRPAILETLIHELLHRRKPRWGERKVTREARALLASMDEPTMRQWWNAYRRTKKKGVPIDVEGE
jgi:hypothetical protein